MKMSKLVANNYFEMNRLSASGNNIMLLGPAGCGKSSVMEDWTGATNRGYVELILSQVEGVDIRGIMVPHRKADGSQPETVSTRTPLAHLVEEQMDMGYQQGVIFFDEYFQASLDVRKAVTQFLTSKRIGNWKLPEGWSIWAASNPPEWRAGTSAAMGHEPSRFNFIDVTADPAGWQLWAHKADIHPLYMTFAEKFPHEVFSAEPPANRGAPHCNPRSLVTAHNYHAYGVTGNNLGTDTSSTEFEVVKGAIGDGAARALFGYLKVQDVMPSPQDMLDDPTGCKIPPAERIDARYACMMQAVHYAGSETNERLFEFVKRLDKEFAVASIKHFCAKDPLAINAPNIADFIAKNPDSAMSLAA